MLFAAAPESQQELAEYWPTTDWQAAPAEAAGMSPRRLQAAVAAIENGGYGIDGLLVIRHGYIVTEYYRGGFRPHDLHPVHSCTKSVVGACVGIAIEDGSISGVNERLIDLFPSRFPDPTSDGEGTAAAVRLEHLLTMTTGMRSRDSYLYRWDGLIRMGQTERTI